jgi:hypothetical protein
MQISARMTPIIFVLVLVRTLTDEIADQMLQL